MLQLWPREYFRLILAFLLCLTVRNCSSDTLNGSYMRVSGGSSLESVPGYVGILLARGSNGPTGRWVGVAIMYKYPYFIAHGNSMRRVWYGEKERNPLSGKKTGVYPAEFAFPGPIVINGEAPLKPADDTRIASIILIREGLGGTSFNLYKLEYEYDSAVHFPGPLLLSEDQPATQECTLYGWSKNPRNALNLEKGNFAYAAFQVKVEDTNCDSSHNCLATSPDEDAGVCYDPADLGSPLFCDGAFSYMVNDVSGETECTRNNIVVTQVKAMTKDIDDAIRAGSTNSQTEAYTAIVASSAGNNFGWIQANNSNPMYIF